MTHLVKILKLYITGGIEEKPAILKLYQTGGIEEKPASPVNSHFLSADQSLSLGSSSPDQESKDKRSRSEHYKEDARPQNLDESKEILDKHDQKN